MKQNLKLLITGMLILCFEMISQAQNQEQKMLKKEIQLLQQQLVPDSRLAIFKIQIDDTNNQVICLKGETNLPEGKSKLIQFLDAKKIQFIDSIRVLPEASLGPKIWAITTLSVSNMRSQPDYPSELVSQTLMGTPVKVFDYKNGWYLVQTPDKYIGWMEQHGLARFTPEEMESWKKSNRYIFTAFSGTAVDSPSRKAMVMSDLVMGDLFVVESFEKGYFKIHFPDGRTGFVKKGYCMSWNSWVSQAPDVKAIISVARQMLGFPYLWGGTSTKAVDCSGLTKTAYFSQGIIMARDASQQVRYGTHPDFKDINSLQPGDLLFFGRSAEHITHVGLYMGNGKYIHSSGLVHINSIDPNDPAYILTQKKELVAASRILNSLNTEEIVPVKDHPWYSLP